MGSAQRRTTRDVLRCGPATLPARVLALALVLGACWALMYALGGAGVVAPHVFYVPILLAANWSRQVGTMLTAVAAGLLAGPLLPSNVAAGTSQPASDWLSRLAFFLAIGLLMAAVIERRRSAEDAERRLAARLASLHELDQAILDERPLAELVEAAGKRVRGHVPCDGVPVTLDLDPPDGSVGRVPPDAESLLAEPISAEGGRIGVLEVWAQRPGAFGPRHAEVVRETAAQLALGVEQARLRDELRRRADELVERLEELRDAHELRRQLLARLVDSQEDERRRIAADIHDDSIQVMTAAELRLQTLRRVLREPTEVEKLEALMGTAQRAIARLRNLLFELRPPVLEREGLATALRAYLEHIAPDAGFRFTVEDGLTSELPEETRTIAYRIAQEAISNVRKHAGTSTVRVALVGDHGGMRLVVEDGGVGFDPDDGDSRRPDHLGLSGMRERAELAGGGCIVRSEPGRGTTVECWLPLAEAPARSAGVG